MIKYKNISEEEYKKLFKEERKIKPYCIEYDDGTKEWIVDGILHREDGPAATYSDGRKYWFINGKRHRENGPAVIYEDGIIHWYLNGIIYTFEEYLEKLNKTNEEKIFLRLKYS